MKKRPIEKKKVDRREFLGLAWAASLFGLFSQASLALFRFLKPRKEAGAFGGQIVAGQLNEFEPGSINHIQQGRFFISRLEDGGVLAMWHRCTHLGCTVPWREDEDQFHCPCHSSIYNKKGEVLSGPAPRPLDLFSVRVENGELVVDTSKPIQRKQFSPNQVFYQS